MKSYLLFESRDPFESASAQDNYDMASGLARAGHDVTLFLVNNAVFAARQCAISARLTAVAATGVTVRADTFALAERGISSDALVDGVEAAGLDLALDQLAAGHTAIWH